MNTAAHANHRWPWLGEFLAGERGAWIFVFKLLLALYAAGWLAMWLQLEQPATAMMTVAIVMHPQSGMVLAKSFYRALGTLVGSAVGLALMGLFPQERELFLLSLSLWVGLCAGGALFYRNFMSYGFVLAGYTAAIVTLPVVSHPLLVFDSAVMRVSEVMLGIAVAGLVSDVILPGRLRPVLRQRAREHFAHFIDFARRTTAGGIPRSEMEQAHLRFVRAAVELEDLRAAVIFEDPEARARSTRMRLLNQRYMAASTSFQSVHHLINRLQREQRAVAEALIALYAPIGTALSPEPALQQEPAVLAERLKNCEAELPALAARLRGQLAPEQQADFDTGAALLRRFADELRAFTALEGSLRVARLRGSVEEVHFRRGNDFAGAGIAVLRTFITMVTLSAVWLASGWTYGGSAMMLATIFSGLFAASPKPLLAIKNTFIGYTIGMVAAYFTVFKLLPGSDGFVMLIAATLPPLLIGGYLITRDKVPGIGVGYTMGFIYILALHSPMTYDPEHFLNDAVAQLIGLGLPGVAFAFIPPVVGTLWLRVRQLQQLRRQVVLAATAPLEGLLHRFESISRDLFHQIVTHTRPESQESRAQLAWALAVHECGRAVIELRQALRADVVPADVEAASLAAVQALAQLYENPTAERWCQADHAIGAAIATTAAALPEALACQPVQAQLYLLRSALRDEESPLAALFPGKTGSVEKEVNHAA